MKARCSHKIGGKQFIKKGKIRETSGAYPIHNSMAGSLSNHTVALQGMVQIVRHCGPSIGASVQ